MRHSPALVRYHAACEQFHEYNADDDDGIAEAWAALPLRTRLRVILAVPWRDALHEIRSAIHGGAQH